MMSDYYNWDELYCSTNLIFTSKCKKYVYTDCVAPILFVILLYWESSIILARPVLTYYVGK